MATGRPSYRNVLNASSNLNHLAHLVLAGPSEGLRLGAFLGDHIKGRVALRELPETWAEGVQLHRWIDRSCDQHPSVRSLTSLWDGPWRRYGPIILDVLFDTMLTRHWNQFGPLPLKEFAHNIDRLLSAHWTHLPNRLKRFARWAQANSLWTRYDDRRMLQLIFDGIQRRHGRPSPLSDGLSRLDGWESEIEATFFDVFQDLRREIAAEPRQPG